MSGRRTVSSNTADNHLGCERRARTSRPGAPQHPAAPTRQWSTDAGTARGFTLTELLIAVAVVGILVTVAVPSYSSVMVRVNRSAAALYMMDVANRQEQHLARHQAYTAIIGAGGLGMTPPMDVAASYAFAAAVAGSDCAGNALSGPGYVITATATGSQAKDGDLCLDSRSNMTPPAKWRF